MATKEKEYTEEERILDNRRKAFRDVMGEDFPADEIEVLARSNAHWSEAKDLLDQGCPPDLIVEILK